MIDVSALARACPHCDFLLPADWSDGGPGRCPTCRLVIGAGRTRPARHVNGRGAAANVLVNRARRAEAAPGDPGVVLAALRQVAELLGEDVARIRMLDYDAARASDPTLPGLEVVIATFTTWKHARHRARSPRPVDAERLEGEAQ